MVLSLEARPRVWKPKAGTLQQKQPKSQAGHASCLSEEDSRSVMNIISNHTWHGSKGTTYTITFGRGRHASCLRTDPNGLMGGTQAFNVSYDKFYNRLWWGVKDAFFVDLADVLEDDSQLSWYHGDDWSKQFTPKFVWWRFPSNEMSHPWRKSQRAPAVTRWKMLADYSQIKREDEERSQELQEQECQDVSDLTTTETPLQGLSVFPDDSSCVDDWSCAGESCADETSTRASTRANSDLSDFNAAGYPHSEFQPKLTCSRPEPQDIPHTKLAMHMHTDLHTCKDLFLQFQ